MNILTLQARMDALQSADDPNTHRELRDLVAFMRAAAFDADTDPSKTFKQVERWLDRLERSRRRAPITIGQALEGAFLAMADNFARGGRS